MKPILTNHYEKNLQKLQVLINNNSKSRIDPSKMIKNRVLNEMKDEKDYLLEIEEEIMDELNIKNDTDNIINETPNTIEGFGNSNSCTSGGEIILIAIIIFAFFKLMTKRDTIKIFN